MGMKQRGSLERGEVSLKGKWVPIVAFAVIVVVSCAALYEIWQYRFSTGATENRETLFQISAFNVFSAGNYDGNTTYGELAKHGDFGIGTLNGLNGEMIALEGTFYQIPTGGTPRQIGTAEKTPYATVTFFEADQVIQVADALNYSELTAYIDNVLPTDNAIYAIKIHGNFDYAKTRSVPMQIKPYLPLTEAIENQTVFTLNNVSATAVGFWFPSSMDGVDFVGYHLHLLTDDKSAGGHLLDCIVRNATIEIDYTHEFEVKLPET
jgi:acetolactate decarboxylase